MNAFIVLMLFAGFLALIAIGLAAFAIIILMQTRNEINDD